ncbi:MAG: nucleoside hydrolase [Acidobacteria bacterium]|nr:MAG: nucleoside hydrolase [Acidobacteriota bacterium]
MARASYTSPRIGTSVVRNRLFSLLFFEVLNLAAPRGIKQTTMVKARAIFVCILTWMVFTACARCAAQSSTSATLQTAPEKVIIDTDIGDDIDDAFAVALALRSPELQILGITTTFGDTEMRAKLLDRLLGEVGRADIPVAAGPPTPPKTAFTQLRYAEGGHFAKTLHPDAVTFLLEEIRRNPGEITLVAIGPLVNVGSAIEKDRDTFRKLKRVVLMGGSIYRGYGDVGNGPPHGPQPEWNILNDIPSAQKLLAAGVPLFVMPLDSTQLKMDAANRNFLFRQGTPTTDALTLLYHQWAQETPTLFDPMTIAFIVKPELCPVEPMRIHIDEKGYTRPVEPPKLANSQGAPYVPNAQVCLKSNPDDFFHFLVPRLAAP